MKTSGAATRFIAVETPVAQAGIAPTHFTIWITHPTALPSVREIPRTGARLLGTHAFSQETQLPLGPQSHQV